MARLKIQIFPEESLWNAAPLNASLCSSIIATLHRIGPGTVAKWNIDFRNHHGTLDGGHTIRSTWCIPPSRFLSGTAHIVRWRAMKTIECLLINEENKWVVFAGGECVVSLPILVEPFGKSAWEGRSRRCNVEDGIHFRESIMADCWSGMLLKVMNMWRIYWKNL